VRETALYRLRPKPAMHLTVARADSQMAAPRCRVIVLNEVQLGLLSKSGIP